MSVFLLQAFFYAYIFFTYMEDLSNLHLPYIDIDRIFLDFISFAVNILNNGLLIIKKKMNKTYL